MLFTLRVLTFTLFLGLVNAQNIAASFSANDKVNLEVFKEMGAETYLDSVPVVKRSEVIFISVKPWVVPTVLQQVKNLSANKLFISIAMGVKLAELEEVNRQFEFENINKMLLF